MNKRLSKIFATTVFIFLSMAILSYPELPNKHVFAQGLSVQSGQKSEGRRLNPVQKILRQSSIIQRDLRQRIVQLTRELKKQPQPRHFIFIVFFSFLYGVIHSIGPGHAKLIILSYFLSVKAKKKDGILLGLITAFIHGLSGFLAAFMITMSFEHVFKRLYPDFNLETVMPVISGVLVIIIGGILLVQVYREFKNKDTTKHGCITDHELNMKNIFATASAIGLVPCAGIIILSSFFMAINRITLSIVSALSMTVGMACTIILMALLSIFFREKILRIYGSGKIQLISACLKATGAFFLVVLGALLLF